MRIGPSPRQRVTSVLLGAGALAVVAIAFALRPAWGITIVVALYYCVRLLLRGLGRVTVDAYGVDVRRVGVAQYAWREITAVREERCRGSREVRLLLIDGRAVRLPAPRTGRILHDPDFDAKAASIKAAWTAALGLPPAEPRPVADRG
ncbi:PH domain-containing protein [Embleya sp. NPDC055664]